MATERVGENQSSSLSTALALAAAAWGRGGMSVPARAPHTSMQQLQPSPNGAVTLIRSLWKHATRIPGLIVFITTVMVRCPVTVTAGPGSVTIYRVRPGTWKVSGLYSQSPVMSYTLGATEQVGVLENISLNL